MTRAPRQAIGAWTTFWFEPVSAAPLALVRIAFGIVAALWTVSLAGDGDFDALFTSGGILPHTNWDAAPGLWSVLRIWPSHGAATALLVVLLIACVLLTLGMFSRVAAIVVFIGIMSLERRNPFVFNSGDGLLRIIALFLIVAPSGAYLSLDRLRRHRADFWQVPLASGVAIRLFQVQLSFIYIGSVWAKLSGASWNDGTAISYALRVDDLHRFALPSFVSTSLLVSNLATYGTLAAESALAILVWNRRARPWVLAVGVILHLSIAYSIRVGFFSMGMLTLYLAFLSPAAADRVIAFARARLARTPMASSSAG